MNDNYDSILNDKKNTQSKLSKIAEENSKKPNYVIIDIIIIILIIVISYVVYFNTILSGKNIILNDLGVIFSKYSNIFYNLGFNYDISNGYSFNGNIDISKDGNENKIIYGINNDGNDTYLNLYNNEVNISYFSDKNSNLVRSNKIGDSYVKFGGLTIDNYVYIYNNIESNIKDFLNDKSNYKRSFYFEGDKPIVKVEINLDKNDINKMIGTGDLNYNINITLLNHALSDDIISAKVIVNNNSNNNRDVYVYNGKTIIHTNDKNILEKYEISNKDNNFTLKVYKNDSLYSVLSGEDVFGNYNYLYQVIDSKYNIKLTVNNSNKNYNYLFDFNIDTDDKKYDMNIDIVGEYTNMGIVDIDDIESVSKKLLNEGQLDSYDNMVSDLLGFEIRDVFIS